jgi:hypothetical protein
MSTNPSALATTAFWQDFHKVKAEITSQRGDDVYHITSIANTRTGMVGGVTVGASHRIAACCIAGGSHRLATDDEVDEELAQQKQRAEMCAVMTEKLQRKSVLLVDRASLRRLGEVEEG